jgi:hypothetical protein
MPTNFLLQNTESKGLENNINTNRKKIVCEGVEWF